MKKTTKSTDYFHPDYDTEILAQCAEDDREWALRDIAISLNNNGFIPARRLGEIETPMPSLFTNLATFITAVAGSCNCDRCTSYREIAEILVSTAKEI